MRNFTFALTALAIFAVNSKVHSLEISPTTKVEISSDKIFIEALALSKFVAAEIQVGKSGTIQLKGKIKYSGDGSVNLIMWSRVENGYYFSRIPLLQGFSSDKETDFVIPFHAKEKIVDSVRLQVNFLSSDGSLELTNLSIEQISK